MRYRLRTLLICVSLLSILCAVAGWSWRRNKAEQEAAQTLNAHGARFTYSDDVRLGALEAWVDARLGREFRSDVNTVRLHDSEANHPEVVSALRRLPGLRRVTVACWPGAALFSLVASLIVDLTVTICLQTDEYRRFAVAEVVDGKCHTLRPTHRGPQSVSYDLECSFNDKAGNRHEASFYVGGIRNNQNDDLSPQLLQALLREQVPFDVQISYDPQRPARVWLTGMGGRYHGWSIHILSNLFVFMQLLSLFAFFALLASYRQRHGQNPWWLSLHKAFPFVVQTTGVMLMGIAELIRR